MTDRSERDHAVTYRQVTAGCPECRRTWDGPNAQGVAVRHHDATGHVTWCDVLMMIRYGELVAAQAGEAAP